MDKMSFKIGTFNIYYYSICILIGMVVATLIILRNSKKEQLNIDDVIDTIFYTIIFGIVGARLYYVLFNLKYYIKNPLEIIEIYKGGLAIHGAILLGSLTAFLISKKKKIDFIKLLDISAIGLIIAQGIGRWGNFFNHEAYGQITSLKFLESINLPKFIINNMYIDGLYREPTFLYESIGCLLGFIFLLVLKNKYKPKKGILASTYLIWYGTLRFFIESRRTDALLLGNLKVAQIVSILFIIIGIISIIKIKKEGKQSE